MPGAAFSQRPRSDGKNTCFPYRSRARGRDWRDGLTSCLSTHARRNLPLNPQNRQVRFDSAFFVEDCEKWQW
jgi:hypothetical protein